MSTRGGHGKHLEAQAALVCGQAFQKLAESFIPRIREIQFGPAQDMPEALGDLAACAASLGFAIELFLKALLSLFGEPVPKGHDLYDLYNAIPPEDRKIVESTYESALPGQLRELGGHASVTIAVGPLHPPEWGDNTSGDHSLTHLLDRSRALFPSWRYICEVTQVQGAPHQIHQFEYALLWCAAEAIRVETVVRLGKIHESGICG